jgi:alkanesulfonate monooxygenase SsuD/methylene tetrahydromethanopterin reductase-like flavin-dependent oxidoreductase (luciferase family)
MKIGIMTGAADLVTLARKAEELGFDALWVVDQSTTPVHIAPVNTAYKMHLEPDGMPQAALLEGMYDPFIALARVSAVTTKITLATGVCSLPNHNPIRLAKQVATLDHLSGGRFIFGIGGGWLRGRDRDHGWRLRSPLGPDPRGHPRHEGAVDKG